MYMGKGSGNYKNRMDMQASAYKKKYVHYINNIKVSPNTKESFNLDYS